MARSQEFFQPLRNLGEVEKLGSGLGGGTETRGSRVSKGPGPGEVRGQLERSGWWLNSSGWGAQEGSGGGDGHLDTWSLMLVGHGGAVMCPWEGTDSWMKLHTFPKTKSFLCSFLWGPSTSDPEASGPLSVEETRVGLCAVGNRATLALVGFVQMGLLCYASL